jgi:hypothetical protein
VEKLQLLAPSFEHRRIGPLQGIHPGGARSRFTAKVTGRGRFSWYRARSTTTLMPLVNQLVLVGLLNRADEK